MDVRHEPTRRIGPPANEVKLWRKTLWICRLLLLGVLTTVAEGPAKSRGTDNPLSSFSVDTLARAAEFYRRTRHPPYQR